MSWERGDQAMCVRTFTSRQLVDEHGVLYEGPVPKPPLVYEVVDVLPAPPGLLDPAPAYLGFAEMPHLVFYDCRHFRKLEPLPPEEADRPERVPELA